MEDVAGFMDASCPRCRRKIGWYGRVVDRPPCPRCGHQIDAATLEHDQAQLNDFRELLAELRQANPGWDTWRKARVAAGLTLRQAARLIGMEPLTLNEIEQGRAQPCPPLADRMARCYGG